MEVSSFVSEELRANLYSQEVQTCSRASVIERRAVQGFDALKLIARGSPTLCVALASARLQHCVLC